MRWKRMERRPPLTPLRRSRTQSSGGGLTICPRCALKLPKATRLSERPWASTWQLNQHIQVSKTKKATAYLKAPREWGQCTHQDPDWSKRLGRGAFGIIVPISEDLCVKQFDSRREFFYEAIANDLMQATRERYPMHSGGSRLLGFVHPCIPCRSIVYPRMKCNLLQLDWSQVNLSVMAAEFTGLMAAVSFLNRYCGMVHCDVSPDNILATGDLTPMNPGRLVLTDFGSVALHSGSKWTNLVVTSNLGFKQHCYDFRVPPKLICKHLYKPSCVLFQCYLSSLGKMHAQVLDQPYPISPNMGLTIDMSSLGYTLLTCLELYLDLPLNNPLKFLGSATRDGRPEPMYYLGFMIPRVVMTQILSAVWTMTLDLGLDCTGKAQAIPMRQEHQLAFQKQCYLYKANQKAESLANCSDKLNCPMLKSLVRKLLERDFFNHGGHPHTRGLVF
nr:ORF36 [Human gammaherpesvirus 8]